MYSLMDSYNLFPHMYLTLQEIRKKLLSEDPEGQSMQSTSTAHTGTLVSRNQLVSPGVKRDYSAAAKQRPISLPPKLSVKPSSKYDSS